MRKVCAAAVDIIKRFESLHDGDLVAIGLQPKLCPAGIWTIGWGHALRGPDGKFLRGESGKKEAYRQYRAMTLEEAENLLALDLEEFAHVVDRLVKVKVSDNQFGALVSLTFNIGRGNFSASTLLRLLNAGNYAGAAMQFAVWRKADGKVMAGLVKRRAAEKALFGF
jgi:lysozyme